MWHVEDVGDVILIVFVCNAIYVEDVEDRSNTPKGCNAMYVTDVKDGKGTYRYIFIITFIIWYHLYVMLCMSKMSKIDQIHLRAVMLCMSKMSKMGKEHTHTFGLITSLILNGFSIPKKVLESWDLGLCILKHVGDVGDRSSTPKGCNAIYVGDIGDHNNLQYTYDLMVWLKRPKSQLSKTFCGLKIH